MTPAPPLPPSYSECLTTLRPAKPGLPDQQMVSKMVRSGDGKRRMDFGNTSVITDPAQQKMAILDHAKKEFKVVPIPPPPGAPPPPPQFTPPGLPAVAPPQSSMKVQDLGKGFIDGHEVEGKRYIIQPPAPPPPPALPKPPRFQKPAAPGLPKLPQAPAPPAVPPPLPPPINMEEWTSTKLHLPVLTKTKGAFGEQISQYKHAVTPEPNPALFQIPPGYKPTIPPAPPAPPVPRPPAPPRGAF